MPQKACGTYSDKIGILHKVLVWYNPSRTQQAREFSRDNDEEFIPDPLARMLCHGKETLPRVFAYQAARRSVRVLHGKHIRQPYINWSAILAC